MTRTVRKALTLTLFAAFAILAPTLLLYTSGYSYNFLKHRIEKTGILHIDIEPTDATVTVDGRIVRRSFPIVLSRLIPETYDVSIARDGYLPWHKRLSVTSATTTFVKDFALLPDTLARLTASFSGHDGAWSPDGSMIAYLTDDDTWTEVRVYGLATDETRPLARYGNTAYSDIALSWSPDGTQVVITADDAETDAPAIFVLPTADGAAPVPVHDTVALQTEGHAWHDGSLLVVTEIGVLEMTPTGVGRTVLPSSRIMDIAAIGDTLWLLAEGATDVTVDRLPIGDTADRQLPETVARLPKSTYRFQSIGSPFMIRDIQRDTHLVVDTGSGEYRSLLGFTAASTPNGNGRILLCGEFELGIHDPATGRTDIVTRRSERISGCSWGPDGDYAIYSTDSEIIAAESDSRDERNTYTLATFERIDSIRVDSDGTLRFIGAVGNQAGLYERPLR